MAPNAWSGRAVNKVPAGCRRRGRVTVVACTVLHEYADLLRARRHSCASLGLVSRANSVFNNLSLFQH
jgi:hypothetical protein